MEHPYRTPEPSLPVAPVLDRVMEALAVFAGAHTDDRVEVRIRRPFRFETEYSKITGYLATAEIDHREVEKSEWSPSANDALEDLARKLRSKVDTAAGVLHGTSRWKSWGESP